MPFGPPEGLYETTAHALPCSFQARFPMMAGLFLCENGVTDCLTLDSEKPNAFGRVRVELVQGFANQAAVAIENARWCEAATRHAEQLTARYKTSQDITSTLELDALQQLIAERCARFTGADRTLIVLVDVKMRKLAMAVGYGFAPGRLDGINYQEVEDGTSGWVIST